MWHFRRPVVMTWVAAAAAVAVATGGVALASDAASTTTYHGCVGRHGELRIASICHDNERAIWWNQRGPAGPRGAKGDRGDAGTAGTNGLNGAPGPSHAWFDGAATTATTLPFTLGASHTLAQTPTLAAGSYVASAVVTVLNTSTTTPETATCTLQTGTGPIDTASLKLDPGTQASLALQIGGSPLVSFAVTTSCSSVDADLKVEDVQQTTLLVGAVT